MPQLYSSGGETRTTSNQLESAQSTDLSGLVGVLKSFNATFGEIARKSTVASLTDTAKVNQTNKILIGDKTLAETPNLLSSEFTAAYEETSKNILVRDLQNDIRDLGAQAEKSNWVNPDGLQQAMHSGYSEMRAKIATNPKLAALILPDLDTQFAEEYQSRRYTVTARRVGQDVEKARYDTKRQADKIDEDMQDTLSNVAYHNAGKVDFSAILEKGVEDVATEYRKIYGGNSFYGEAETAKIIDEKQDKFADKMMHSAIKGFLAKGDLIGLRKFVADVNEGQFFKNNRTLSDGLWKRSAGGAKIRTDLKYFITQLESEAMNAKDPSDLLARIQGSEALKGNTFADDLDVMRGQDNETTWQAIKSLYAVASVYNKGNGESEQDQFQTLALTFVANGMMKSGNAAKVSEILGQMSADTQGSMTFEYTAPDEAGNVKLSMGGIELFEIPEPKKDANDNYIINTAQEALYEQAKNNPTPVFKQKIINALQARVDKRNVQMQASEAKNGNAVYAVEKDDKLPPISVDANLGENIKARIARNSASASMEYGEQKSKTSRAPISEITGKPIAGQLDLLHESSDYPTVVDALRQIERAADESVGVQRSGVYQALGKKWDTVGHLVSVLDNSNAEKLLDAIPRGQKYATAQTLLAGALPSGTVRFLFNQKYAAKLDAIAGGDSELANKILDTVILPAIAGSVIDSGADLKEGKADISGIVNQALTKKGSAVADIMESIDKPSYAVNPAGKLGRKTYDQRWGEPSTKAAITAITTGVGFNGPNRAVLALKYPVITVNEAGRKVVRLANSPNGSAYLAVDGTMTGPVYEVEIK